MFTAKINPPLSKQRTTVLLLLALSAYTLISLFFSPGYDVFAFDQQRYLPPLYQRLDPELYLRDIGTMSPQTDYTIFDEFINLLLKTGIDLFVLLFILTVIARWLFFYLIYKIAAYFTENRWFSLFVPVLFIINHLAFGSAVSIMDYELHPRTISLVFNLLFLLLYARGQRFFSTLFLGLGLWMHSITTIPFLLIFYIHLFFFNSKKSALEGKTPFERKAMPRKIINLNLPNMALALVPILFLLFFAWFLAPPGTLSLFDQVDAAWKEIILPRMPYAFLFTTVSLATIDLIADSVTMGLLWIISKQQFVSWMPVRKKKLFNLLLYVPLVLFIVSGIMVDIFNSHFFMSLQLSRSLSLWKLFLPLAFSYYSFQKIKNNQADFFNNFLLLGSLLSYIISEKTLLIFLPVLFLSWLSAKLKNSRLKWPELKTVVVKIASSKPVLSILFLILSLSFIFLVNFAGQYRDLSSYSFNYKLALILALAALTSLIIYCRHYRRKKQLLYGLILIFLILLTSAVHFYQPLSLQPRIVQNQSFNELCNWIKENTSKDDLFLTEPFSDLSSDLRLLCFRNIYFSYSADGAVVFFDRNPALEWNRRLLLTQELVMANSQEMISTLGREGIDYVLSESQIIQLSGYLKYQNQDYYLYHFKP